MYNIDECHAASQGSMCRDIKIDLPCVQKFAPDIMNIWHVFVAAARAHRFKVDFLDQVHCLLMSMTVILLIGIV